MAQPNPVRSCDERKSRATYHQRATARTAAAPDTTKSRADEEVNCHVEWTPGSPKGMDKEAGVVRPTEGGPEPPPPAPPPPPPHPRSKIMPDERIRPDSLDRVERGKPSNPSVEKARPAPPPPPPTPNKEKK